ncbi:hypothetical protein XELAEV_18016860mg [Xenopus laevis]|uniref:Reverse transcriptase domain-containing protein n=1 Tax=Xenopus laevis TaxID=8355 RepID=A0A974HS41_XENLA|nr:hypothetical protein XELAEV_18016860mg [Xenopus laevis]
MDALRHLEGITLQEDQFIACLDVESLYMSIVHEIGLRAINDTLNQRGQQYSKHNRFILELLEFIFKHNYFTFSGKYYHQIRGTAMGSTCAPAYANLYLGWWERNFVFSDDLVEYSQYITLWLRYIDDVVGTTTKFDEFVKKLNTNTINLRVTSEISYEAVNFLVIHIYRDKENNLQTSVYRKNTATNNLLHAKSQHPSNLIKGIPTGQYLCVRRLCSTPGNFKIEAKKLYDRFKQRGYSHNCLKRAYKRALESDRSSLLIPRKNNNNNKKLEQSTNSKQQIRLIGDFSSQYREIFNILQKHWHILEQDLDLKEVIGNYPQITYRRSKNLKDRLIQSHYRNPIQSTWLSHNTKGCYRCGDCLACPYVCKSTKIIGRFDINEYVTKQFMNLCGKKYVGKTKREFRRRILEHVGDVRNKRNTSVANHVNLYHNGDNGAMKFTAVEHIKSTTRIGDIDNKLLQREAEWIYWLNTKVPAGLNEGFTFSHFL